MLLRRDRAMLAIDIALDVAFHAGRGADLTGAAEIAERLGAQRRGIEPVLQALSRADILESIRGPRGGYRLARAPRAITLAEVVAAVAAEDEDPPLPAGRLAAAVTAPLWGELAASVQERLAALTVSDLLRRAAAAGLVRPRTEPLDFAI
ncbi:RrF2 family transcriptional regulator [Falsiroseomonas oryziterrae]|uniref:RrF2 family transcriptional regulator n=1 Tax=Falsiroseomonas oryziterrae TaxID=2911368 RepID=UPI001F3ED5F1|nr:Rrf2 family transcriptional regulator [Roseomonas sp. NPKOSM-4]